MKLTKIPPQISANIFKPPSRDEIYKQLQQPNKLL